MIPSNEVVGIDLTDDWSAILEQLRDSQHTRLPVYEGELDKIIGVLHMKRVASELAHGQLTRESIREIAAQRGAMFVPEGTPLNKQLLDFQRDQRRFAFVVDEYGQLLGLITLEDLLEEIVGEFNSDSGSVAHKDVEQESPGVYRVNASATIRALNRALGWHLPSEGPKTLNGLVLERLETIPHAGTVLRIDGYLIEVLQIAENRIRIVRVKTYSGRA